MRSHRCQPSRDDGNVRRRTYAREMHWKPHDKSMPPYMAMMFTLVCVRRRAQKAQASPHLEEKLLATDYPIAQRVRMPLVCGIKRDVRKPPIRVLSRAPIPA